MRKHFLHAIIALLAIAGCDQTGTNPAESSVTTEVTTVVTTAETTAAHETPVEPVIADIPGTGYSCTVTTSAENSTDLTVTITESDSVIQTITVSVAEDEMRHEPAMAMREVLLADADFDGDTDILVSHGRYGAQGLRRYRCFLNDTETGTVTECKEFFDIPDPAVDSENKQIKATSRISSVFRYYGIYRWADGVPTETLSITENITKDGGFSYEISDPDYPAESVKADFYGVTSDGEVIFTETP